MGKIAGDQLVNKMNKKSEMSKLNPKKLEKLVYWFFRLNGCLTIENFIVHPTKGPSELTEIDLVAARFPGRIELPRSENPMQDYELFIRERDRIQIFLVDAKAGECEINRPWIKNMRDIISAIGPLKCEELVNAASKKICDCGQYKDEDTLISLVCLGLEENPNEYRRFPEMHQLILEKIIHFFYQRFEAYQVPKRDHKQWDDFGHMLWDCVDKSSNEDEFRSEILNELRKN
jgi:hypothetical protein